MCLCAWGALRPSCENRMHCMHRRNNKKAFTGCVRTCVHLSLHSRKDESREGSQPTAIRGPTLLRLPTTGAALSAIHAGMRSAILLSLKGKVHADCSGVVFAGCRQDSSTRRKCMAHSCGIPLYARARPVTLLLQRIYCYFQYTSWYCQEERSRAPHDPDVAPARQRAILPARVRAYLYAAPAVSIFQIYGNQSHA